MKKELFVYATLSGDVANIEYMLHNFGYRGSSSQESAAINGGSHLTCFFGTDNIAGMEFVEKYYEGVSPGYSVPAAEHSTITSWGKDGETNAYKNILDKFPTGIVSIVSDSYDIKNACENIWGETLRQQIVDNPDRKVVIRPDSGDPLESIKSCLSILGDKFGYSTKKGYKVLPDYIRILQGDGISYKTLPIIMEGILKSGWSIDNVVFGSGGGLIQECTRDTQKFAIKCSWASINGKSVDVYKEPKSDYSKTSKKGRLKLIKDGNSYKTASENADGNDKLVETFRDGEILSTSTLENIRRRIDSQI